MSALLKALEARDAVEKEPFAAIFAAHDTALQQTKDLRRTNEALERCAAGDRVCSVAASRSAPVFLTPRWLYAACLTCSRHSDLTASRREVEVRV